MPCEYFINKNGKVSCQAYGQLNEVSLEKLSECESDSTNCFEIASEFLKLKRNDERGNLTHLLINF